MQPCRGAYGGERRQLRRAQPRQMRCRQGFFQHGFGRLADGQLLGADAARGTNRRGQRELQRIHTKGPFHIYTLSFLYGRNQGLWTQKPGRFGPMSSGTKKPRGGCPAGRYRTFVLLQRRIKRETRQKRFDLLGNVRQVRVVLRVGDGVVDKRGDLGHIGFFHSARGDGRRP